jgi:hypothetical protein
MTVSPGRACALTAPATAQPLKAVSLSYPHGEQRVADVVTGSGRRNTKLSKLKIEALTPMPRPRQRTAINVKPGDLRNNRNG